MIFEFYKDITSSYIQTVIGESCEDAGYYPVLAAYTRAMASHVRESVQLVTCLIDGLTMTGGPGRSKDTSTQRSLGSNVSAEHSQFSGNLRHVRAHVNTPDSVGIGVDNGAEGRH